MTNSKCAPEGSRVFPRTLTPPIFVRLLPVEFEIQLRLRPPVVPRCAALELNPPQGALPKRRPFDGIISVTVH